MEIIFSPTGDRTRSAGLSPTLYRVAIKAVSYPFLYRKAVQVYHLPIPGDTKMRVNRP